MPPKKPIWTQLWNYLNQIIKADMGYSFYYGLPVMELIIGRLGWTLLLSIVSILISSLIGISLGIAAAMCKGKVFDIATTINAIIVESIPVFFIAVLIQLIFAYNLGFYPAQGAYSPGMDFHTEGFIADVGKHSVLPLICIIISLVPSMIILTRNVVVKVKEEDYVKMAVYNNVDRWSIMKRYILKNSLPEILTKMNMQFVYAVAGTLFVEMIFSYPGMGTLLKTAVSARDYCLIQGIFLVTGLYGIIVNIIFGWILGMISPRWAR